MDLKSFIKTHQQKIALSVGYLLVAILAFGLGKITAFQYSVPEVKIEEAFSAPLNNTQNLGQVQSASVDNSDGDCAGKIKGNINSKGKKIYHVLGGAFYKQTNPEACFSTEADAKAAGFTKSSR